MSANERCMHCGDLLSDHWGNKCMKCPCGSNAPSPEQQALTSFRVEVANERKRQIGKGYTPEHDAEHGIEHLLSWAAHYAYRGESVKVWALLEAATEALAHRSQDVSTEYAVKHKGVKVIDPMLEQHARYWVEHKEGKLMQREVGPWVPVSPVAGSSE